MKFEEKVGFAFVFLVLIGFVWFVFEKNPPPGIEFPQKAENSYNAKDLIIISETDPCDNLYLGSWNVENYGEMELFCENGQYFGEISPYFSISMKELSQKGYFLAIFCMDGTCYSHPVVIEGNSLHDVYGEYVEASR